MKFSAENINLALGTIHKPKIGLVSEKNVPESLMQILRGNSLITPLENKNAIPNLLKLDSIDIGLVFKAKTMATTNFVQEVECIYNTMQNSIEVEQVIGVLEEYEDGIIAKNVLDLGLDESVINPLVLNKTNTLSPFLLIHKIMGQVKRVASNTLNFIFIFLLIWSVRVLVIRSEFEGQTHFGANLFVIFGATILSMIVVYLGFQFGIRTEVEGITKSLALNIQNIFTWNKVTSVFILWLPTWLCIIGFFGVSISKSKNIISAYSHSFGVAIILFITALISLIPIEEMGVIQTILPVTNVFGMGQLILKDSADSLGWYAAFFATSIWAGIINILWYKIKISKEPHF
ncbi:hypothetical protein OAK19_02555 [Aureispira]|nr:hypothetical protein [Aureispira sp.]